MPEMSVKKRRPNIKSRLTPSIKSVPDTNTAAITGDITIIIFQNPVLKSAKALNFAFKYKDRNTITVNTDPVCPLGYDCRAFFIILGLLVQIVTGAHIISLGIPT